MHVPANNNRLRNRLCNVTRRQRDGRKFAMSTTEWAAPASTRQQVSGGTTVPTTTTPLPSSTTGGRVFPPHDRIWVPVPVSPDFPPRATPSPDRGTSHNHTNQFFVCIACVRYRRAPRRAGLPGSRRLVGNNRFRISSVVATASRRSPFFN